MFSVLQYLLFNLSWRFWKWKTKRPAPTASTLAERCTAWNVSDSKTDTKTCLWTRLPYRQSRLWQVKSNLKRMATVIRFFFTVLSAYKADCSFRPSYGNAARFLSDSPCADRAVLCGRLTVRASAPWQWWRSTASIRRPCWLCRRGRCTPIRHDVAGRSSRGI